jgi:hypothetical protein
MKRQAVAWTVAFGLLAGGMPAWADDAETQALKAEVESLKSRLAQLEAKISEEGKGALIPPTGGEGISSIGEKAGPALLELPSGLQGLGMSGYVDVSYIYNFAESDPGSGSRTNRGRVFDTEPGGFTIHAAELVLEKPVTDAMPIGGRMDIFAGDDADLIGATGLTDPTDTLTTGDQTLTSDDTDQFDLQQAYVTARAPIGAGIDFKVGKFVTLLGAEVIESPANWNFSRSYLFGYAIPFTHTGALVSYPLLGELGSVTGGVVNGWDNVDDNNKAKSLLGNITLTPLEGVTVGVNGITGAEVGSDNRNDRSVIDLVGTWQATDQLTLMANWDFGHQSVGSGTFDGREWTGLALYGKYDLTPTWSLAGRWEWFDDKDNFRTAFTTLDGTSPSDIDFYGYTLTSQWKLHEHVLARLEYRHDKADEDVFFHDGAGFINYQDTVAAELIYHF